MSNAVYADVVRNHVKGEYGQWRLVVLASGGWSAVWHAFLDVEKAFIAIVNEDREWFNSQLVFAQPPRYDTEAEALQKIVEAINREMAECPAMAGCFEEDLRNARRAIDRLKEKQTKGKA